MILDTVYNIFSSFTFLFQKDGRDFFFFALKAKLQSYAKTQNNFSLQGTLNLSIQFITSYSHMCICIYLVFSF